MKIVIENITFPFDLGCRILKLQHNTSPFEQLNDMWNDIIPLTFKEIAEMVNLEHRRVAMLSFGLERMANEVEPILVSKKTIKKTTNYINQNGELVTQKFNDTYELFKVKGDKLGKADRWGRTPNDCHFVKFKDTSTDRNYMIWVDLRSVFQTNNTKHTWFDESKIGSINAIQCIAWTIQTNVPKGKIKEILRQGDCILIKPIEENVKMLSSPRHLTEEEYRTLLVAES